MMDVKEAIEWLNDKAVFLPKYKAYTELVELLQQGEKCRSDFTILVGRWDELFEENKINKKYRQMWEELEDSCDPEGNPEYEYKYADEVMDIIKQKYFPKEKRDETMGYII